MYIQSGFSPEQEGSLLASIDRIESTQASEVRFRKYAMYVGIASAVLVAIKTGLISIDIFRRWRS